MVVSLNYCSQNGGNFYRAPYSNGNPNIGPRVIGNLDQSPYGLEGFLTYLLSLPDPPSRDRAIRAQGRGFRCEITSSPIWLGGDCWKVRGGFRV